MFSKYFVCGRGLGVGVGGEEEEKNHAEKKTPKKS